MPVSCTTMCSRTKTAQVVDTKDQKGKQGHRLGVPYSKGQDRTRQRPNHTPNGYGVLFWSDGLELDRGCN